MNTPLVSIVTPSFNQAAYIEETLESVRRARTAYPHIEHIVMDGGSTDGTIQILKRRSDIVWSSGRDEGQADAINQGWRRSEGEILAYLNSDDLYEPDAVRSVVDYLQAHPEVSAVYGVCRMIDANGRQLMIWNPPAFNIKDYLRLGISFVPQQTFFFKRDVLDQVGYLDPELKHVMDYDFIARVARYGIIQRLPLVTASFRLHSTSKSMTENSYQRQESLTIQKRYLSEPGWLTTLGLLKYKLKRTVSWPRGGPPPILTWLTYTLSDNRLGIKS